MIAMMIHPSGLIKTEVPLPARTHLKKDNYWEKKCTKDPLKWSV
jgi:hypothetical protein